MKARASLHPATKWLLPALLCATSLAHAQPTGQADSTKDQTRHPHPSRTRPIDPSVAQQVGNIPIRLECRRQAPTEFPDQYYGIVVTNRGPYTIAAGRQVRWDIQGAQPQGGLFTLAAALPVGKDVTPVAVLTRADGAPACSARLAP